MAGTEFLSVRIYLKGRWQAIEVSHSVQQLLGLLVPSFSHEVEGCFWKLPAVEQEWRGTEGEDDLVDPPDANKVPH